MLQIAKLRVGQPNPSLLVDPLTSRRSSEQVLRHGKWVNNPGVRALENGRLVVSDPTFHVDMMVASWDNSRKNMSIFLDTRAQWHSMPHKHSQALRRPASKPGQAEPTSRSQTNGRAVSAIVWAIGTLGLHGMAHTLNVSKHLIPLDKNKAAMAMCSQGSSKFTNDVIAASYCPLEPIPAKRIAALAAFLATPEHAECKGGSKHSPTWARTFRIVLCKY